MNPFLQLLLFVLIFAAYWLPSIIAAVRHVHGIGQVIVVNLLLGWSGLGWIIALVMAYRHVPRRVDDGLIA